MIIYKMPYTLMYALLLIVSLLCQTFNVIVPPHFGIKPALETHIGLHMIFFSVHTEQTMISLIVVIFVTVILMHFDIIPCLQLLYLKLL